MEFFKKAFLFTVILILALTLTGCSNKEQAAEEVIANRIPVEAVEVRQGDFTNTIILSGTTKPNASVTVIPKIMGAEKIIGIGVQVGDKVSAGQTIATLDQSTINLQMENAQKALQLATRAYEDTKISYERNKVLFEAGAIPKATMEQIETGLKQAEISMKQAQLNVDSQQIAYNNTLVKAPISGIVTAVMTEVGTLASGQTPLAQIVDIDSLELTATINEMQVNKLKVNDRVEVMIPALDRETFPGTIKNISPVMEDRLKAYPITITLNNRDHKIKGGMYAEVEVVIDTIKGAMIIPAQAVIKRNGTTNVFIVEDGKALVRDVVTGFSNGKETVILEGLDVGQKVIIRGNDSVVNGDLVAEVNRGER